MNGKIIGAVLGVVQLFLWFAPWVYVNEDSSMYQAGIHIGGITYLLLFAAFVYSVLSWMELHIPRLIAASVVLAISLLYLVQAGDSNAWGLNFLILTSITGIVIAVKDNKASSKISQA